MPAGGGGAADVGAVGPGTAAPGRVDHEVDLARLEQLDRVDGRRRRRSAPVSLPITASTDEPLGLEGGRGARGRHEREPELGEAARRDHPRRLVAVGERQEDHARRRQPVARRALALGERETERAVDAHHLAGRAHLGAEHGVDVGEAVEREHRLLHRDVPADRGRSQQPFVAQLVERGAEHHARRGLGQRHAGRLAHERHRAARAWVGFDHEDVAVFHRVLHVEQPADVERVGERAGGASICVDDVGVAASAAGSRTWSLPAYGFRAC